MNDGFDDIVLGFDGGNNECGCVPSSSLDDRVITAGVVVLHGGDATESNSPYAPNPAEITNIALPVVYQNNLPTTRLADVNHDGLEDLHLVAGVTNSVIFARNGLESRELGPVESPTANLEPHIGFGFEANEPMGIQSSAFWDINADGAVDAIIRAEGGFEVYLGEASPLAFGNGDIQETVDVNDSSYVIYRVAGTVKETSTPIRSVALSSSSQESSSQLRDNFVAEQSGVLLEAAVSTPRRDGDAIEFDISLTYRGPGSRLADVRVSETISNLLTDVTWSLDPPRPGDEIQLNVGTLQDEIPALVRGVTQVYTVRGIVPQVDSIRGEIILELSDEFFDLRTLASEVRIASEFPLLGSAEVFADFDADGVVGFSDFLTLAANFGKQEDDPLQGDLVDDGIVDFEDFRLFAEQFGRRTD